MKSEAKIWLKKAEDDLAAARILFEKGFYDLAAFHAQQSAEKALKALWIEKFGEIPPKTHSISHLLKVLGLGEKAGDVSVLTKAYLAARYPDVGTGYSMQDAAEILNSSSNILELVKEVLAWA